MTVAFELSTFVDRLAGPAGLKLSLALLHFLWQGVLIAAGAAVLMRVLGRRSANRRYAIGVAGMALMAAAPVVTFCVVTPPEPVPPPDLGEAASDDLLFEVERLDALIAAVEGGIGKPEEASETVAAGDEIAIPPRPLTWAERVRLWQPYALLAWLAGTGLFALRLGVGVRASRRFGRARRPLPEAWLKVAAEVAGRLGLKAPKVFVSDGAVEAVAVGLLRPMVLLPAAWLGRVPPEVLEAVLAHELAHLRRHDLWVNLLQRCVEAALFYHPAVWWLSRRVRVEREYCCDEAALAVSGRAAYARALEFVAAEAVAVRAAAAGPAFSAALAAGMGGESMALLDRVRRVLGADVGPPRGNWMSEGLLALAVPAALWAGIAAVGPAVAQADEGKDIAAEERSDDERETAHEESEDVLILRDAHKSDEGAEGGSSDVLESRRLPVLGEIPLIGRLFTLEDADGDAHGDVLIARGDSEGSDEADDEENSKEDDVRAALRELRAEMKALRGEVEELRSGRPEGARPPLPADINAYRYTPLPADIKPLLDEYREATRARDEAAEAAANEKAVGLANSHKRLVEAQRRLDRLRKEIEETERRAPGGVDGGERRIEEKRFRYDVRPLGPLPKGPPAGELRLESRTEEKDGPPRFILRRPDPKGDGPARFEVRVFKSKDDGPPPDQFIKRLHVEDGDGRPRVFLFREGKDGKPEKVEGKVEGDETVIETEEGRIHVRPMHEHRREIVVMLEIDGKQVPVVVEESSDDPLSLRGDVRVRVPKPLPPGADVQPDPRTPSDRAHDEAVHRLEEELRHLRKALEQGRANEVLHRLEEERLQLRKELQKSQANGGRRPEDDVPLARSPEEAKQLQTREGLAAKLEALRLEDAALQQSLGENHPRRAVIRKHIEGLEKVLKARPDKADPNDEENEAEQTRQTRVFALKHAEAVRLAEQFNEAHRESESAHAAADERTNSLIVSAPAEVLEQIDGVIRKVDAPTWAAQDAERQLQAAKAEAEKARAEALEAEARAEKIRRDAEAALHEAEAKRDAVLRAEKEQAEAARQRQQEATQVEAAEQARRAEQAADEAAQAEKERAKAEELRAREADDAEGAESDPAAHEEPEQPAEDEAEARGGVIERAFAFYVGLLR